MGKRENGWNAEFLRKLGDYPLELARERAVSLLNGGSTRDTKKRALSRDVQAAKTSAEVQRIMYYAYLAGSGMGIQGSAWQRDHK